MRVLHLNAIKKEAKRTVAPVMTSKITKINPIILSIQSDLIKQVEACEAVEQRSQNPLLTGMESIGCGYNVLGCYARPDFVKGRLFDLDKANLVDISIENTKFSVFDFVDVRKIDISDYENITGSTVAEYQNKMSSKSNIGASFCGFGGQINADFEQSETQKSTNSFSTSSMYVRKYAIHLNVQKFRNFLSSSAKAAIETGNIDDLLSTYGTHFLAGIVVGGKASISIVIDKYENSVTSSTSLAAKANFLDLVNGGTNYSTSSGSSVSSNFSRTTIQTIGGNEAVGGVRLIEEHGLSNWCDSVTLNDCSLIDFTVPTTQVPLVGIWELATSPQRRTLLKREAEAYVKKNAVDPKMTQFPPVNYQIVVKTGTRDSAGTDARVYVVLEGEYNTSPKLFLNDPKKDDFENGHTDYFQKSLNDLGRIRKIKVGHDNHGEKPGWDLEHVQIIAGGSPAYTALFPCHAWIDKNVSERELTC